MAEETLQHRLYRVEKESGWDPDDLNTFGEEIAHLHDEVSEAFRWFRKHKDFALVYGESGKPEGVPAEFADVVIGMAYLAERFGFDLFEAVDIKSSFNASRSYAKEARRLHEPKTGPGPCSFCQGPAVVSDFGCDCCARCLHPVL